jgi:endo-1,4-beta-xylanase
VTPKQLELMKGVFNFSMIPFSGKWNFIEPEEGKRNYEELDQYVDWCVKNGIGMEFHYLSGFTPRWATRLPEDKLREAWMRHCRDVVGRYHDRIKYWQVINDRRLEQFAAEAFVELKRQYPDIKLGTSDCQTFYTGSGGMMMGGMAGPRQGMDEIQRLKAEGVQPDFFATHGHKPNGVWPDMRSVYEALDEFAKLGVKIQVSEATVSLSAQIYGRPEYDGQRWTPELQAKFLEQFYTTLFSHPAVEMINYWDLSASNPRGSGFGGGGGGVRGGTGEAGLLDPMKNDEPRLAYMRLKELIRGRWMTQESGRLGRDGAVAFRGFHGDYEVLVKTPSGKTLTGRFSVKPEGENKLQLKLTEATAPGVARGE